MKEFRIVAAADRFKVQRKFLWWWNDIRVISEHQPVDAPLSKILWFATSGEALDYIFENAPSPLFVQMP